MQIIKPGVLYALEDFTGGGTQPVRFTHKTPEGFVNGTTVEELIAVAIDKVYEFQRRSPSEFNQEALTHLMSAQDCLRKRLRHKIKNHYQRDGS